MAPETKSLNVALCVNFTEALYNYKVCLSLLMLRLPKLSLEVGRLESAKLRA